MTDNLTTNPVNSELLNRDYTLIIDRSGSMGEPLQGSNQNRWQAAAEGASSLARKVTEFDTDGITLYLFANQFKRYDGVDANKVAEIFRTEEPNGGTHLAEVLTHAVENYFARRAQGKAQPHGESFFVITDGLPDNEASVVQVIKGAAARLNNGKEMSITFIQIGNDAHARDFLKRLDDQLESEGAKYDIVDVITMDDMGSRTLTAVLTDAILEHKQHAA